MTAMVLATDEAFAAATNIKTTLEQGLGKTLEDLRTNGAVLCDPTRWAGQTASTFKEGWEGTTLPHLVQLKADLENLQSQIQQVLTAIQDAGGGLR
jgi:uncharacterized protein YukE